MPDIAIVASAFGADAVRHDGHRAWVGVAAQAGAAGFEVRRELFANEAEADGESLRALGDAIRDCGMWSVYSTPGELFTADGALDLRALRLACDEAQALGARFVKLQLGGFAGDAHAPAFADEIAECIHGMTVRVVVENGQMARGGTLAQFVALFDALQAAERADLLGMTFDVGNWQWTGEAPSEAARQLARRVEYIHCKGVAGEGARRFPVAPAVDDPAFIGVLRALPPGVPRGIEFPFDSRDGLNAQDRRDERIAAEATRHVAWLAHL